MKQKKPQGKIDPHGAIPGHRRDGIRCMVTVRERSLYVRLLVENPKTAWVELPDGAKIKRHKVKHTF